MAKQQNEGFESFLNEMSREHIKFCEVTGAPYHEIQSTVTYIGVEHLQLKSRNKSIEEITYFDVADMKLLRCASVLILKKDGQYRVLKSTY